MSDLDINNFNKILRTFDISANCVNYKAIDNYFFYDLELRPQAKVKDIQRFADEISLSLKSCSKPNIRILHQEGIVRLEFATSRQKRLDLFDYFINDNIPKGELPCLLGQALNGERVWMDLSQNPHMIISGTTGSGKSTLLHTIIANLFNYNKVKLFLIDPKNVEFLEYDKKINNDVQVSYSYHDSLVLLDQLIDTMETRYSLLRESNIKSLPYIVLIIDEFGDLILQDSNKEFYTKLCKLAQKCRAAKMNIIISTQRPSVNIINGAIKANFPARISCKVASHIDSKIILDATGAENLMGHGDALLKDNSRSMERFQIAYTNPEQVCSYFGDVNE
jgi:S-DNA-T family DNA segregation ATPase FtsK/SpoIIIE